MARLKFTPDQLDPLAAAPGSDLLDPTVTDPTGGTGEVTGTGEVSGGPAQAPVEYEPPVPLPPPYVAPYEPPVTGVEPTEPTESSLPTVPAGPIPGDDEVVPLATPPPLNTPTGLPTFGVGGSVSQGLRTPTFRSNRVVGGGAGDVLLNGITSRFGPGVPVAQAPLPSGLTGDTGEGIGAYTDEDLLKKSIMGRR